MHFKAAESQFRYSEDSPWYPESFLLHRTVTTRQLLGKGGIKKTR